MTAPVHSDHDGLAASVKIALAWIGTVWGTLTLQDVVLIATLVYTLLNTFFLVRDRWYSRRRKGGR